MSLTTGCASGFTNRAAIALGEAELSSASEVRVAMLELAQTWLALAAACRCPECTSLSRPGSTD